VCFGDTSKLLLKLVVLLLLLLQPPPLQLSTSNEATAAVGCLSLLQLVAAAVAGNPNTAGLGGAVAVVHDSQMPAGDLASVFSAGVMCDECVADML
jgi:hypothetical protein